MAGTLTSARNTSESFTPTSDSKKYETYLKETKIRVLTELQKLLFEQLKLNIVRPGIDKVQLLEAITRVSGKNLKNYNYNVILTKVLENNVSFYQKSHIIF